LSLARTSTSASPIRVLALIEAASVTGPAKNLIGFARRARPAVELTVVTYRRRSDSGEELLPALTEASIPMEVIRESGMGDPRVAPQLVRLFRAHRPDIIQTHNTKSHFLMRLMRRARPCPWIAFHHGFTSRNRKDRAYNRIGRWAMKGADRVVAVCDAFACDLRAAGVPESRISLRHNFVLPFSAPPAEAIAALRARLGIPNGAQVMLAVGRLSPEKGHADLLEALTLVKQADPGTDFRAVIVGEGAERANLEGQRHALGLDGIVLLPGQQTDVRPFYAMADLLVLPSHSEGSPNVLLEAMSAGLPIVATNAGGIVEIAAHGETAMIVPTRDAPAFAAAIQRLRSNPDLARRLAVQAKREAARFTPEAYVESMIGIYRQVVANSTVR
jgi:glycosyltransferase involved in cell wall biosynthesis